MALDELAVTIEQRKQDLEFKKQELETIVKETEEEEKALMQTRIGFEADVDDRLLRAYQRIRKTVKNGIGVAPIVSGSCGGCFAKIPPQRQSDIKQRKKIIVCENCGRVLIDAGLSEEVEAEMHL
jgi:predicted  nucleic acid-binding Zn-ribbon protein